MPVLLALLGLISAAAIWYYRARDAHHAAGDLMEMANDVRLAARRFGFKRKVNVHPVDSIDDPRLAAAGIVAAVAGMGASIEGDDLAEMSRQFQSVFQVERGEADEIITFARWIAEQCGTRSEAVRRLSKRLASLAGGNVRQDLDRMLDAVIAVRGHPCEDQADARGTIDRYLPQT